MALLAVGGCDSIFGTEEPVQVERQLGVILYYGDLAYIELPGTVRVNVPFDVSIRTYAGGCIAQADTEVQVNGMVATVAPFDSFIVKLPARRPCTADLRHYTHASRITFTTVGRALVIFRGRREPGNEFVSIELPLNVVD